MSAALKLAKKVKERKLKTKETPKRGNPAEHNKILKDSLVDLVQDLLPLAIADYKDNHTQGKAYVITNMISEIRGVIAQIESSIDADKLVVTVSSVIAIQLRASINRELNAILMFKNSIDQKINNSAHRRTIELLLNSLQKDYEQNIIATISNIERDMAEAIKTVLKGKQNKKR